MTSDSMSAETHTIPDDIMRLAGELTNAAIRNYERNRPANIARDAIAKAINDAVMAERKRCEVAVAMACHVGKYTPLSEYIAAIRATPKAGG